MNIVSFVSLGEGKVLGEICLVINRLHMVHTVRQEVDGITLLNGNEEEIRCKFKETKIYKNYKITVQKDNDFIQLSVFSI